MSSRPLLKPHAVITNGSMSGSITSEPTIVQMLSLVSYTVSWSGTTPIGEMSVEVSNDYCINPDGSVKNPGTWTALELSAAATVSGNTGAGAIGISLIEFYATRLVYTRTSGTGTMQATVVAKVA